MEGSCRGPPPKRMAAIPCESLARRAKALHPRGDARVLEWKLRIWLDTRIIIFGGLAASSSLNCLDPATSFLHRRWSLCMMSVVAVLTFTRGE
jgi:hypothetical protein